MRIAQEALAILKTIRSDYKLAYVDELSVDHVIKLCVNKINEENVNAFMIAASNGDIDTMKSLLANGVQINAHCISGSTAWHYAVRRNHSHVIDFLIANGGDVNADSNKMGDTALHLVAELRQGKGLALMERLIASGADVHAVNILGETPLHIATKQGEVDSVAYLIQHGADTDAIDHLNRTACSLARFLGHTEVANFLGAYKENEKLAAQARSDSKSDEHRLEF